MIKYYITHTLSRDEKEEYFNKGLYAYDLRDSDFGGDIATIEPRVIINRVGSIITNKKLDFSKEHDYIDYEDFTKNNQPVDKIEELFKRNREREER